MWSGSRRAAIAAVAVALAVSSACGDDDGGSEARPSEQFCTQFGPLNDEADALFSSGDPSGEEFDALIERVSDLDPPDEIAEDFGLVIEAFTLASRSASGDSEAEAELTRRFDEFDEADERLEPFMRDTCGLDYGD